MLLPLSGDRRLARIRLLVLDGGRASRFRAKPTLAAYNVVWLIVSSAGG
jgi:hypothetical protein